MLLIVFLTVFTLFRQSDLALMLQPLGDEDGCGAIRDTESAFEPTSMPKGGAVAGVAMNRLIVSSENDCGAMPPNAIQNSEGLCQENRPMSWKARMVVLAQEYDLTNREIEVFLMLAKGLNARTVSDALGFSYSTARVHVRNIYAKLDVHSRDELLEFVAYHDRCLKS